MSQYAEAIIDLGALRHNLSKVKSCAPNAKVMAIIKANAYGHGTNLVVKALEQQVDAFALSNIQEAVQMRATGNRSRLVVLTGCRSVEDVMLAAAQDLDLVIHHPSQWELLEQVEASKPLHLWIKIDTGMHRLGFLPEQWSDIHTRLSQLGRRVASVRLMSHLANADDLEDVKTHEQKTLFDQSPFPVEMERSLANSAGILGWPTTHYDWVRPGVMLYGVSPLVNRTGQEDGLRPVMKLQTRLIAIKDLKKGDAVGYGGAWRCPQALRLGVAAVGYGDGYPRHLIHQAYVLIRSKPVPIIGRVSMDMITLDLRQHPEVEIGDQVVCWGPGLPAETIAQAAGTIAYDLLCNVARRVEAYCQD